MCFHIFEKLTILFHSTLKVLVEKRSKELLHCKLRYSVEKTGYACIQAPQPKVSKLKKKIEIRLLLKSSVVFLLVDNFSCSQPIQMKKEKSNGILTREKPLQREMCDLTIVKLEVGLWIKQFCKCCGISKRPSP